MADAVAEQGGAARWRPASARAAPALASFAAVLAVLGSSRPGLPSPARLAEVGVGALAWELSMAGSCAALRRRWGALDAPGLAAAVLLASAPATAALFAAVRACGDAVAPAALYASSLALGLLLAFARRGLAPPRPPRPPRHPSPRHGTRARPSCAATRRRWRGSA